MWALFPSLMSYTRNAAWSALTYFSCRLHLLSTALFRMTFFQDDIFTLIVSNGRLAHRDLCLVTGENFLHRLTHSWWFMSTLNLIVLFGRSMQDKRCVWEIWERERFELLLTSQAVCMQFTQLSDVVTHLLSVEDRGQEVAWRDMNPHVHEEVFHAALFLLRRAWMCCLSCSSNKMHKWNPVPRTDLKSYVIVVISVWILERKNAWPALSVIIM